MDNEDRADPPRAGFIGYRPPTAAHGPSFGSASRLGPQPTPPISAQPEFQPTAHGQQPQTMAPGSVDQSTSLPSALPVHHLPGQFASGPLHTPYNIFPAQYVMPTHPPLYHNQPSQTHIYHGYRPLGHGQYPPTQYFPLSRHQPQPQPQPYVPHPSSLGGIDVSYRQPQHLPPPMPHFATSSPGPSHPGPYVGIPQYMPVHGTTGHYASPQHYRPPVYQWYPAPADRFIEGDPIQLQQQHPTISSQPLSQHSHRGFMPLRHQSTVSEQLPSPSQGPSSSSASISASGYTVSSATCGSPELVSEKIFPKSDAHLSQKPAASTSSTQDNLPVRRHYHPNPPPNRSEWVMWVGNIPNDATHDELWRFLKHSLPTSTGPQGVGGIRDSGVLSVFLISRSNCAFVNYHTEEQLNRAISQCNGRKLRPHDRRCPQLVCRARRKEDDLQSGVGAQRGRGVHTRYVKNVLQNGRVSLRRDAALSKGRRSDPSQRREPPLSPSVFKEEEILKPDTGEGTNQKVPTQSPGSHASTSSSFLSRYFPKRFFILKSLSQYDLDLSTKRGVWATQKHNESVLDQAYRTSKEVILIFSVNKSGEFYGHARMASGISRGNRSISWAQRADSSSNTSSPSGSRVPSQGSPERSENQFHETQIPKYTPPSERLSVETSFSSTSFSDGTNKDATSVSHATPALQLRRSAPPTLDCGGEDLISPEQLFRSQGLSQVSQIPDPPLDSGSSWGPEPIPTQRHELGKYPGVRIVPRSESGGTEDPVNHGLRLPPVVEERRTESGSVEEGPQIQTKLPASTHSGLPGGREQDSSWGETFRVEWLCVDRVPFHRTRHLRNPWNHGREIKVSRDGTELEPSVGQQLVDSWSILASDPAGGVGARRASGGVGKRGGRPFVSKPGRESKMEVVQEGSS